VSIYSLLATVEAICNLGTPGSNDTSAAPMSGHVQGWDSLECSLAFRGLLSARSIESDGRADELSLAKIVSGASAFEISNI
jgi:hypothetical protein